MSALLAGSRWTAHTLSLTSGSTSPLWQLFPAVEHIQRFNMRPDGQTAVVRLRGDADLPLIGGLLESLGGSVTVTVESRARAGVVEEVP